MQTRRNAILQLAAVTASATAVPALADTHAHAHEMPDQAAAAAPAPNVPAYFSQTDWDTVSQISELIIPRTDTPGALDAKVPHKIDFRLSTAKPELQDQVKAALVYLQQQAQSANQPAFSGLPEAQRIAILTSMSASPEAAGYPHFRVLKDLTIEAYYSTEEGLVKELGYQGNTFRTSFPGCTHPEHWPVMEEKTK